MKQPNIFILRKILKLFDYIYSELKRKHHIKRMGGLKNLAHPAFYRDKARNCCTCKYLGHGIQDLQTNFDPKKYPARSKSAV